MENSINDEYDDIFNNNEKYIRNNCAKFFNLRIFKKKFNVLFSGKQYN